VNWEAESRRILKSELTRKGVTYPQLAEALQRQRIFMTPRAITNKLSRGTFSFGFFLKCMYAIGTRELKLWPGQESGDARPLEEKAAGSPNTGRGRKP
jgi:hypothetical protein